MKNFNLLKISQVSTWMEKGSGHFHSLNSPSIKHFKLIFSASNYSVKALRQKFEVRNRTSGLQ